MWDFYSSGQNMGPFQVSYWLRLICLCFALAPIGCANGHEISSRFPGAEIRVARYRGTSYRGAVPLWVILGVEAVLYNDPGLPRPAQILWSMELSDYYGLVSQDKVITVFVRPHGPARSVSSIMETLAHELAHLRVWPHGQNHQNLALKYLGIIESESSIKDYLQLKPYVYGPKAL